MVGREPCFHLLKIVDLSQRYMFLHGFVRVPVKNQEYNYFSDVETNPCYMWRISRRR